MADYLRVGQVVEDWPRLGAVTIVSMRRIGPNHHHEAEFVLRDAGGVEHTQKWNGAVAHQVPPLPGDEV